MKSTSEMIDVMQAYLKGEQIEVRLIREPDGWSESKQPIWDWSTFDYRVRKKKYVPFESAEEFLKAQWMHGDSILFDDDGWSYSAFVNAFNDVRLERQDTYTTSFEKLLTYKFKDGTPCGKEVIDE